MLVLNFHTDPGHGWLEADLAFVRRQVKGISDYSYIKGDRAYLEEDCDAGKYLDVLKKIGIAFKFNEIHTDSSHPIRNYSRFNQL